MRKAFVVAIAVALTIGVGSQALAVDYGEFQYWYSDAHRIGQFDQTLKTVCMVIDDDTSMTPSKMQLYVSHALGAWQSGTTPTTSFPAWTPI